MCRIVRFLLEATEDFKRKSRGLFSPEKARPMEISDTRTFSDSSKRRPAASLEAP